MFPIPKASQSSSENLDLVRRVWRDFLVSSSFLSFLSSIAGLNHRYLNEQIHYSLGLLAGKAKSLHVSCIYSNLNRIHRHCHLTVGLKLNREGLSNPFISFAHKSGPYIINTSVKLSRKPLKTMLLTICNSH